MNSKIALIHDHLAQNGGAERTLEVFMDMYKDAPVFTTVWNKDRSSQHFLDKDIRTSFIQRMPMGLKHYQWFLPLMPIAFEQMDLDPYDLVISSCSALSKGVIVPPQAKHVCYCYTPTRYLWSDRNSYVNNLHIPRWMKGMLSLYLHFLRTWDFTAASRVDFFIAISREVQDRIKRFYGRESEIIYPPVDVKPFEVGNGSGGYYVTGGRLTYYKRFDITVEAFSKLNIPLMVFGDGPEKEKLQKIAKPNITFLGRISERQLRTLLSNAIAFINPQVEDFGMTVVESMASGRPVIAFNQGGALEIIEDKVSGTFFDEQSWEALADTIIRFDHTQYDPRAVRKQAEKFSVENFQKQFTSFLRSKNLIN